MYVLVYKERQEKKTKQKTIESSKQATISSVEC